MNYFLVVYSKSKGVFDGFEEREEIICSNEKLIELLQHRITGIVWSALRINKEEYLLNHPDKEVKVYE
jgi:hypothetical protein